MTQQRGPGRPVLLVWGVVFAVTTVAILSGYLMLGRGDPAARVIRSVAASRDLGGFASDAAQWRDTWVPGYFLVQGAWIATLERVGVDELRALVRSVLWLSTLAWAATLWAAHRAVSVVSGSERGWLAVTSLLAIPLLTELAHNAYAGIYFAAFYAAALWALASFERSRSLLPLSAAALLLLAASTFRTEAVVAASGMALVIGRRHGVGRAAGFFALASIVTVVRMGLAVAAPEPAGAFFQQAPQPWAGRLVDLGTLLLYLIVPNGIALGAVGMCLRSDRDTAAPTAPNALAAYAVSSGAGVLAFMLSGMLLFPMLGPDSRFLVVPLVGAVVALASTAASPTHAWTRMRRWWAPWVLTATALQIGVLGIDYLTDPPRPPAEIREAAAWLHEHSGPDRLVAVDQLRWWEQSLLLHGARTPETLLRSYVHTSPPPLPPSDDPQDRTEIAGAYLAAYRPEFLALQGPAAERSVAGNLWVSESSTFRPWVDAVAGGLRITPGLPEGPTGTAVLVHENRWVRLYRVNWSRAVAHAAQ